MKFVIELEEKRITTWNPNFNNNKVLTPSTQCFMLKERHLHFLYMKLKIQSVIQLFLLYLWFLTNNNFLLAHLVEKGDGISSNYKEKIFSLYI